MIRFFDFLFSFLGIIILSPFLILIAFFILFTSKGPIFYKQVRVGKDGMDFFVFKFRTMFVNSDSKGLLTVGAKDKRVTRIGYFLRKYKLDELPQLLNVLIGEMSLVGPRPEVRKYVNVYTIEQRKVLKVRPGITDWASIHYKNENIILESSIDPEYDYINIILPDKIRYNLIFIENYSIQQYFKILFKTLSVIK